jgi:hypothetical protein
MQVNLVDVRAVRGSSMAQRLLGKVSAQRITAIDLDNKSIGSKLAAEAVAAMLIVNAPTLTRLQLRCNMIDRLECVQYENPMSFCVLEYQLR